MDIIVIVIIIRGLDFLLQARSSAKGARVLIPAAFYAGRLLRTSLFPHRFGMSGWYSHVPFTEAFQAFIVIVAILRAADRFCQCNLHIAIALGTLMRIQDFDGVIGRVLPIHGVRDKIGVFFKPRFVIFLYIICPVCRVDRKQPFAIALIYAGPDRRYVCRSMLVAVVAINGDGGRRYILAAKTKIHSGRNALGKSRRSTRHNHQHKGQHTGSEKFTR